jgi:hypothetical protein
MCRPSLLPTTVLAVFTLGCGDQSVPAEPTSTLRPSAITEQKANGEGAQVLRFGAQFLFINDPDRDFSLTLGVPISEAPECGGPGELTGGTVQVVTTPAQIEHVLAQFQRETMTLYDHFTANPCELTEADVVAQGVGNGKLGVLTRAANTLFQIQATGTVELTEGGLAHLVLKGHLHIDADGSLRVHVDRFKLTPIGG